jgi:TolB protein
MHLVRSIAFALMLTAAAAAAADRGTIAYVDEAGEIHAVLPDGSADRKLATAEPLQPIAFRPAAEGRNFFTWPVWSPDATRLAAFRVTGEGEAIVDSVYIIDVATTRVVERYEQPGLRPIYAYWSPSGDRLAMLLQLEGGFSLSLWPDEKSGKPRSIAVGVPFFYDWSKDSHRMLAHLGNDPDSPAGHSVTMFELADGKRRAISKSPAVFGPASWSPDGKWFAHATLGEKNEARLVIADATSAKEKAGVAVSPRVAFNWSPKKPVVAVATTKAPEDPVYQEIRLLDAATGKSSVLRREPISAFFWSPDGGDLLLASRDLESGAFEWLVVDVATKDVRKLGRFYPSRPQLMVFQYFDQYALSHRVWSPDGREFVFSGAVENDPASPHPILSPRIYVVDVSGKLPPRGVGDGHTGFWSPK